MPQRRTGTIWRRSSRTRCVSTTQPWCGCGTRIRVSCRGWVGNRFRRPGVRESCPARWCRRTPRSAPTRCALLSAAPAVSVSIRASPWIPRGAERLPPDRRFRARGRRPARVLVELAERGVALAQEHGSSHGPAGIAARSGSTRGRRCRGARVGVSMRMVFALDRNGIRAARGRDRTGRTGPGPSGSIVVTARCTVRIGFPARGRTDTAVGDLDQPRSGVAG